MQRLTDLRVGVRLGGAFAVTAGMLLILAVVGLSSSSSQGSAAGSLSASVRNVRDAQQLKFQGSDFNGWQTAYAFDIIRGVPGASSDNASSRAAFLASVAKFRQILAVVDSENAPGQQQTDMNEIQGDLNQFMATDNQVITLYRTGTAAGVKQASALVVGKEITIYNAISAAVNN